MNCESRKFSWNDRRIGVLAVFIPLILAILACNLPAKAKPDPQATMNAALTEVNAAAAYPTSTIEVATPVQQAPAATSTPTD